MNQSQQQSGSEAPNPVLAANIKTLMKGIGVGALRDRMASAGYQIGQGTISRALAGDEGIRLESLKKLATFFDVGIDALLQIELGSMDDIELSGEFKEVRRLNVRFSNGKGQLVYFEDDRPPLVFRTDFLKRIGIAAGDAVIVDADGISNEPTIPEGSVVLVNKGLRERLDGSFFAFRANGELFIKRLDRLENVGVVATADNPNFKPKMRVYTENDDFEVIGKAVWTGSIL